MAVHPLAGQPAPRDILINIPRLMSAYFALQPDPAEPGQRVAFGTSGHRGTSLARSFNEDHVLAISQAICEYRRAQGIDRPALPGHGHPRPVRSPPKSRPSKSSPPTGCRFMIQRDGGYTPTPVISHAILTHNHGRTAALADGVVITPSHNPPADGGFKYNPPDRRPGRHGHHPRHPGPRQRDPRRRPARRAPPALRRAPSPRTPRASIDYVTPYVDDLGAVIDMEAIAAAGLKIGVDPLGGAGIAYWDPIAERYGLDIDLANPCVDPTFAFMTVDKDGKIRMDCSSPYAMAGLIGAQGPVRHRLRQRPRLRPPRHRHPDRAACSTPTITSPWPSTTSSRTAPAGATMPPWARPWSPAP